MKLKQVYVGYEGKEQPGADGFRYCPRCQMELVPRAIEHRPRLACPNCGYIRYRNPAPVVCLLIVDAGRILLGRRGSPPGQGKWATPSGYIEYEDDFLTTARREAKEETGLDVALLSIVNVMSSFVAPGYHFFSVYVLAHVTGGELRAGDDVEDVGWFPLGGPLPELAFQEDADVLAAISHDGWEGLPADPDFAEPTWQT